MASATDFAKLVPGFDFLQGLLKGAGAALPGMGQWVAPTLDPQELDKRIEQLKTVQFWLEQNARMLSATIQALEVQRMTLSTLKSMNVPVADLADAFKARMPGAGAPQAASAAPAAAADPPAAPGSRGARARPRKAAASGEAAHAADAAGSAPMVDPMQWWGALTQQFSQLAAKAVQEGAAVAAPLVQKSAKGPTGSNGSPGSPATPGSPKRRGPPRGQRT
ncbi:MAG: PhaM family polyhydroxyalkanoate granule multifunctional regulatory protein [Rubrivivax sp.]